MRAGRLVTILRLLQTRGRMSTTELAAELEVSRRTVLRDIAELSGAGVPVYAVRGAQGGFELLDRFLDLPLPTPSAWEQGRRVGRVRVRLSPHGCRLVAVLDRPTGLRVHRGDPPPDRPDWVEASVRIDSVHDLLALGPEVEVLRPPELRAAMRAAGRRTAALHR